MSAATTPTADASSSDAELIADFKADMDTAGIKTKDKIEADGELHRVHVEGDRPHSRNGWYVLNLDQELPSGAFGSWKLDLKSTWCPKASAELTPAERITLRAQRRRQAKQRAEAEAKRHAEARKRAQALRKRGGPADRAHPYLVRKAVSPHGLRQDGDRLMVPICDFDDVLHGLQFIGPDGVKRFLTGSNKRAHFYLIGVPRDVAVMCEGYATGATIHEATERAVVVAFDRSNLRPVAEALRKKYPDIRIIIAADNDRQTAGNPGIADARHAAMAVGGFVAVPEFREGEDGTDFNDLARHYGAEAVRAAIEAEVTGDTHDPSDEAEVREPHHRFKLIQFDDIRFHEDCDYLVKDIIPREGLCVVWGPPKGGKSFWVYDVMMHVALGWDYRGRRINQGSVVYVACEGERGLGARTEAFRQAKLAEEHEPVPFYLVISRLDLINEHKVLIRDIQAQVGELHPIAIVIDTLNRSLQGSEGHDEDMSAYVGAADAIRGMFDCVVIIIHHCGVESSRPRGHTSLTGAADAQIAVKRDINDTIITEVEWMKDGLEGVQTL